MANFNTRVQLKNDIEANWQQAVNFKPLLGEVIIYRAEKAGDALPKDPNNPSQNLRNYYIAYPRVKVGDGSANVNDLPFIDEFAIKDLQERLQEKTQVQIIAWGADD